MSPDLAAGSRLRLGCVLGLLVIGEFADWNHGGRQIYIEY